MHSKKIGCPIIFWTLIFVEMSWIQRFTGIPQISEISPFQLTFLTSINSYKPGISSDFNRVSKFGTHWDKWIAFKKIKLTLQQQYRQHNFQNFCSKSEFQKMLSVTVYWKCQNSDTFLPKVFFKNQISW